MKFILHCTIKPHNRNPSLQRLKTLGDQAPANVNILGRWHSLDNLEAWVVAEAKDELTVAQWLLGWTDLNVNKVIPVIDSNEMDQLLKENEFK